MRYGPEVALTKCMRKGPAPRYIVVVVWMALMAGPTGARAGQYLNQCTQSAKSADQQCTGAVQSANAADAARSANTGAGAGTNIKNNAGSLGRDIGSQRGNLAGAKGQCESAKQQCSQACDQAKQQADAAAAKGDKSAKADAGQIPGAKKSQCEQPIDSKIGQLQQADSNLGQDGKGSQDTKNASQGGGMPPMQMPQMPQKGEDKKDQTDPTKQAQPGQGPDCNKTGAERFSDCNEQLISKCSGNMASGECHSFANRYCGLSGSTSSGAAAIAPAPRTNLVVDKRGEGSGSDFCQTVNAYYFCQKDGRGGCPSCLKLNGAPTNSAMLDKAKETCPTDPSFLNGGKEKKDDPNASGPVPTPEKPVGLGGTKDRIVGGAGGTAGSSARISLPGGLSPESRKGEGATGAGAPGGRSSATGTQAGGGGGGSEVGGYDGGGSSGDSGSDPLPEFKPFGADNGRNGKRLPATAKSPDANGGLDVPPARDVARSLGPSLFTIGSTAYRNYCVRSQLRSCR